MAKQLGRSFLLKIGDGATPEVFSALAGINSKSLTINNSSIDVTTPDDGRAGILEQGRRIPLVLLLRLHQVRQSGLHVELFECGGDIHLGAPSSDEFSELLVGQPAAAVERDRDGPTGHDVRYPIEVDDRSRLIGGES